MLYYQAFLRHISRVGAKKTRMGMGDEVNPIAPRDFETLMTSQGTETPLEREERSEICNLGVCDCEKPRLSDRTACDTWGTVGDNEYDCGRRIWKSTLWVVLFWLSQQAYYSKRFPGELRAFSVCLERVPVPDTPQSSQRISFSYPKSFRTLATYW